MFFMPARGSSLLGLGLTPAVASLLHGMGGPIIGTGAMNFLFRKMTDTVAVKALLLTNVIIHLFGLGADIWGIDDGILTIIKMAPVESTHLFVGMGLLLYFLKLKSSKIRTE